ncbi:hypothetical protein ABZT02_01265 [Streptomyces sp. NPDC005402]|uniref:hypothetical protein n=1 Tax=Streptomyces sp. NPDC005402 TaxID=3155338 RepID=UPI0033BF7414
MGTQLVEAGPGPAARGYAAREGAHAARARVRLPASNSSVTQLLRFRRLRIRSQIRDDIHHAFTTLGRVVACRAICATHSGESMGRR